MKNIVGSFLIAFAMASSVFAQDKKLIDYVDPFIGTGGHGHTFPGATLPFGAVQLSPDTDTEGWDWCSGYHYSDNSIMGFSHTHLSGTGCADLGDILFMPTVGDLKFNPGKKDKPKDGYRSHFTHEQEKASPGYYSVYLDDYRVIAELTATTRAGLHRYTYPTTEKANIIIDLLHGLDGDDCEAHIKFVGRNAVEGWRRSHGWAEDHTVYFYATFSQPFINYGVAIDDKLIDGQAEGNGKNVKAYVRFSTRESVPVLVRIGISAVGIDGARKNVEKEIPDFNFDVARMKAQNIWETELSKIQVESKDEDKKTIFYTALYHSLITPNMFTDVDGKYIGMDKKIHTAKGFDYYTVFSLWDTFRAEHPLFTIIDPKRAGDFVKTLLEKYKECGLLPVWELASNETWCMIGYHSIPVIFDAYMKGIRNFDTKLALEAMKKSAERDQLGLKLYRERGFIPADKETESVSKTLEYSYDDWCIAQFAKEIGSKEDYQKYNQRSLFYKNLFDKSTGFMRGKLYNGSWVTPFEPRAVTHEYTEATSWQYNFYVPQDVKGMIDLNGGKDDFIKKLDGLFSESEKLEGKQQLDITGLIGQYAHGNEPSHHVAYLYSYAGAPWKTQERVRDIMEKLYTSKVDGLCGNDDCGQMSAWYVFSALGFYPVCPGQNTYVLGSPLFDKVTINLENGKKFVINAQNVSEQNKYIQLASLNGLAYSYPYITHSDLLNGGELNLVMKDIPNKLWGFDNAALFSMRPAEGGVLMPYAATSGEVFYDSLNVKLICETPNVKIRYTLNGTEPDFDSPLYEAPISIHRPTTVKAFAYTDNDNKSFTMTTKFYESKYPPVAYENSYSSKYSGGGAMALTDGRTGTTNYQCGQWQGFEGNNLNAVIDLIKPTVIGNISIGFLNDTDKWIFLPREVVFSVSEDGINYKRVADVLNDMSITNTTLMIKKFAAKINPVQARYLKVSAKNIGVCPAWHKAAGEKAWLFADEIVIK